MVAAGPMPIKALIADDEAVSREILQSYLENLGCRVQAVSNGNEVLSAFEERAGQIGLVMLDVCMPGPCARNLYDLIRTLSPTVPVLFCSAFPSDDSAMRFIDERGLRLLKKPFDGLECMEAITSVLKQADAHSDLDVATMACVELGTPCPHCGRGLAVVSSLAPDLVRQMIRHRADEIGVPVRCGSCGSETVLSRALPATQRTEVLIADDESIHRRILESYLGGFGCRVHTAKSGYELLIACDRGPESIRLAVVDVRMPGPPPIQLYEGIREVRPDLPVLFCSGAGPDDPAICSINQHGLQLLPKPFHRSDLHQAIQNVLKTTRNGRPSVPDLQSTSAAI